MLELSLHPDVEIDYTRALAWYQRRSARAAQRVAAQISRTLTMIRQFPEMYPQLDEQHRFAIVKRYPFTIIYRLLEGRIRVVAIAHSRRSMKFWQGRN